jgi:hypothetical protein
MYIGEATFPVTHSVFNKTRIYFCGDLFTTQHKINIPSFIDRGILSPSLGVVSDINQTSSIEYPSIFSITGSHK